MKPSIKSAMKDRMQGKPGTRGVADDVDVLIPGHGSIGGADQVRARIEQDRAYVQALRDGRVPDDPRVGPSATFDWLSGMPEWQLQRLSQTRERDGTPA
jgi:hypothetical protein